MIRPAAAYPTALPSGRTSLRHCKTRLRHYETCDSCALALARPDQQEVSPDPQMWASGPEWHEPLGLTAPQQTGVLPSAANDTVSSTRSQEVKHMNFRSLVISPSRRSVSLPHRTVNRPDQDLLTPQSRPARTARRRTHLVPRNEEEEEERPRLRRPDGGPLRHSNWYPHTFQPAVIRAGLPNAR